jgi:hypothetical protein
VGTKDTYKARVNGEVVYENRNLVVPTRSRLLSIIHSGGGGPLPALCGGLLIAGTIR